MAMAACAFVLYATYSLYYHPVPTVSDMTRDVAMALEWIHDRYPDRRIVFGGYSSGGHVAACTLAKVNNHSTSWCTAIDAILYISPVLSVPAATTVSPFASLILVRALLTLIWGCDWRHTVPSPLDDDIPSAVSNVPHWIVACRSEVPLCGDILGPLLSGAAYHAKMQSSNGTTNSTYRELVTTNHWTMLASTEFHQLTQESWGEILQVVVGAAAQLSTTSK